MRTSEDHGHNDHNIRRAEDDPSCRPAPFKRKGFLEPHNDDDPDGYYPPPTEGPAGRDPSGECKYTMSDNPSVRVAAGSTFKWEWFSIGVILDRCHFFAVKRMRYVSWLEEGTVSESGHVSFADGKNGDDMRRTTDYPQPGGTKTGGVV